MPDDPDTQILKQQLLAQQNQPVQNTGSQGLTEAQVVAIVQREVNAALQRINISGPYVSGGYPSWSIGAPTSFSGKGTCDGAGGIDISGSLS